MTSLPRLSEDGADEFEARLLRSARSDGASADRERILAALAVAGAVTAAGSGGLAGSVAGAKATPAVIKRLGSLKTLALLGLGVVAGIGGLVLYRSSGPAEDAVATVTAPLPLPSSARIAAPVAAAEPPPAEGASPSEPKPASRSGVVRSKAKSRRGTAVTGDSLLIEVSIVDRARLQLSKRDGAGARKTAEAYLARFPQGRLAGEAKVIRLRAVLLTHGQAAAAPLAASFLREHPDSPHAAMARGVVEAASPGRKPAD